MSSSSGRVHTGAERLCADPSLVAGGRLGLITNYTGVVGDLRTTTTALLAAGVPITALFGPEHGLRGTTQAGESEIADHDPDSGLPLYDTYRHSGSELEDLIRRAEVDTLLYDLQDIGTRFYTYIWTMYDLLVAAAASGVRFVILDRPNPVGGIVAEGPLLEPSAASFVGRTSIPIRHGLTVGELARHLNRTAVPEAAGRSADLSVIEVSGWGRHQYADRTGQPWVMPSVNIPTLDSAVVYPGTGLFEGSNLSEGRGTTRPFELIGAPYVDGRWARQLNDLDLPGVRFRDSSFTPTFHKYVGEMVRGVQLHVHDRTVFAPVATAVAMMHTLRILYPDDFGWRAPQSGLEHQSRRPAIDLLWGSDTLRRTLDAGDDPAPLLAATGIRAPGDWVDDGVLLY